MRLQFLIRLKDNIGCAAANACKATIDLTAPPNLRWRELPLCRRLIVDN